jgi:signal recognition particle subunit SRP72
VRHIANVNSLAVKPNSNPYLTHRIFHSTSSLPKNDLPFDFQTTPLKQSAYAIDILSLKYPGVAQSTFKLLEKLATPSISPAINTLSVINAAAKAQNQIGKPGLKKLVPLLEKRPTDVGLLLTIIQLYAVLGNTHAATELIEKFIKRLDENSTDETIGEVRFSPGMVATLVSLHASRGSTSAIKATLTAAAEYWRSRPGVNDNEPLPHVALLKAAGSTLLESGDQGDAETAVAIFRDLHRHNSADRASAAGLVAALALSRPSQLDPSLLDQVTPADRLVIGIDADALEKAGVAKLPEPKDSGSKKRAADTEDQAKKPVAKKKKKLLKSRTPKDFVPGKILDPERWLPMRDRSYWKPKGKRGKQRAAGLTQGGAVSEDTPKEASKPATAGSSSQQKKKKKGKGGKW